jgi:hypothetical protein
MVLYGEECSEVVRKGRESKCELKGYKSHQGFSFDTSGPNSRQKKRRGERGSI